MRVFIADDSAVLCERLIVVLSEIYGIAIVGQAGEPEEAARLIRSLKPDLVLLDIRMSILTAPW